MNTHTDKSFAHVLVVMGIALLISTLFHSNTQPMVSHANAITAESVELEQHTDDEYTIIPPSFCGVQDVRRLPGQVGNYSSRQLSPNELRRVLESDQIRLVIRLNTDGIDEAGPMRTEEERGICRAFEVGFKTMKPWARDAPALIEHELKQGNVLIHCTNGFDATGAMVGYYLRREGFTPDQVIEFLGWEDYDQETGIYQKYYKIGIKL